MPHASAFPARPIPKISPDQVVAIRNFWNALQNIQDLESLQSWSTRELLKLDELGAKQDFEELCGAGCTPLLLAAIIASIRIAPSIENFWAEVVGSPDQREKVRRSLERAARTVEKAFAPLIAEEQQNPNITWVPSHLSPLKLSQELRFYSEFLSFSGILKSVLEVHSIVEFAKYILAGYVKQATGEFRDRQVSGLLSAVLGPDDFNETAFRMWRKRNYLRLDRNFSAITLVLLELQNLINS